MPSTALLVDDAFIDDAFPGDAFPGDAASMSDVRPRSLRRARRARSPKPRFAVFILLIFGITAVFSTISSPQSTPFNYYLSIVWSSYFPLAIVGITGAALPSYSEPHPTLS